MRESYARADKQRIRGSETRAADWKELAMQDAVFLGVTILFFMIALAYVHFCERVR